jgi:hypothetical protein
MNIFKSFTELFKIFLDNTSEEGYDIYINSADAEISQTAHELQMAEQTQAQYFETFDEVVKKNSKRINNIVVNPNTVKSKSILKNSKKTEHQIEK